MNKLLNEFIIYYQYSYYFIYIQQWSVKLINKKWTIKINEWKGTT